MLGRLTFKVILTLKVGLIRDSFRLIHFFKLRIFIRTLHRRDLVPLTLF